MLSSDLDFYLPPELIAQTPHEPRDQSRLLHVRRGAAFASALSHRRVSDLPQILQSGDLLVFNDTRVLRARLWGRKTSGGKIEALLLREEKRNLWQALLKPSARLRVGEQVFFTAQSRSGESDGELTIPATLLEREESSWRVQFEPPAEKNLREFLPQLGEVPVPPYIKQAPREEQYQTVFAQDVPIEAENQDISGATPVPTLDSCAAPTAGLHFSQALLQNLQERGVNTQFLTLGVGVGTFRPVQTETLEEHAMHEEEYSVSEETACAINAQKRNGKRVIAVGTTTLRVLESVCDESGCITPGNGKTAIFIRPGFQFRCVDALLTNFHLPRSTLLALVAAFLEAGPAGIRNAAGDADLTGLEAVHYAYAQAIDAGYRFFSFGDAMLIE